MGRALDRAMEILRENDEKLHEIAEYLLERETISGDEFMEILKDSGKGEEEER